MEGLARQITKNRKLLKFRLVHFRLVSKAWKDIGKALGGTGTLLEFGIQATNIGQGDNLENLLNGLSKNRSLETIDFSDNDLNDRHGRLILIFLRKQCEMKDN